MSAAQAQMFLPYEIHVTVAEGTAAAFRHACAELGVKPIIIELQTRSGGAIQDIMTSSVHHGDDQSALAEATRIANGLHCQGYDVVREKIETVPWHPDAPSRAKPGSMMPTGGYFEAHLQVVCDVDRRGRLEAITRIFGAHLSRNAFKARDDGSFIIMVTHRAYEGDQEQFSDEISRLLGDLKDGGFVVEKEIVEFAIHDTKVTHDAAWTA